jgi:hypothetical protein
LRFEAIDGTDAAAELFPGLPAEIATAIIASHAAMVAHPEPMTDTEARLTGRPARSFAQWAHDHVDDFAAPARSGPGCARCPGRTAEHAGEQRLRFELEPYEEPEGHGRRPPQCEVNGRSLKIRMPRYLFIHACLCG